MGRLAVKKEIIENAAIYLFSTKGLARTTIRDIAGKAGVAEGAMYRHYSGKNDMAWSLFSKEVERFSVGLIPLLFNPEVPFKSKVCSGIEYMYKYYQDYPNRFAFILLTQHGFPGEKLLDDQTNPNDIIIRFVKENIRCGNIRKADPVILSGLLMGAILQPVLMHWYKRHEIMPEKMSNYVQEACLCMIQKK